MEIPYPLSPAVNREQITEVSAAYRLHAGKVLLTITLFMVTYFGALVLSVGLLLLSFIVAGMIITYLKGLFALLIVVAIVGSMAMVSYFLIKFLFSTKSKSKEGKIELTEQEYPQLFAFIGKLCEETQTEKPRKVFLGPGVNAMVYYNSSFLSLILPAGKNLEIGAGLVNSLNLSEFKAVLAHELGHFSQSSTKLGAYIYRFNKVLEDLLFDNEDFSKTLNAWGSAHVVFATFTWLTVAVVKGIIALFGSIYRLMNLSYLALSREMEFHADAVAVSVTGNEAIINALRRVEFGEAVYSNLLKLVIDAHSEKEIRPINLYRLHRELMMSWAKANKLQVEEGLPMITKDLVKKMEVPSRLQYQNVWASHPTTDEREIHAKSFDVFGERRKDSAWILFPDPEAVQRKISAIVPELEKKNQETETWDDERALSLVREQEDGKQYDPMLAEYFSHTTNAYEPVLADQLDVVSKLPREQILGDDIVNRVKRSRKNIEEREIMLQISSGHLPVKKFVFDGVAYSRYHSREVYEQLLADTLKDEAWLKDHNTLVSTWFYSIALSRDAGEAQAYQELLRFNVGFSEDAQKLALFKQEIETYYKDHVSKYRSVDDIPYQRKAIIEIYERLIHFQTGITERFIPAVLKSHFTSGYEPIFREKISDPSELQGIDGIAPMHTDLTTVVEKLYKLFSDCNKAVFEKQQQLLEGLHQPSTALEEGA